LFFSVAAKFIWIGDSEQASPVFLITQAGCLRYFRPIMPDFAAIVFFRGRKIHLDWGFGTGFACFSHHTSRMLALLSANHAAFRGHCFFLLKFAGDLYSFALLSRPNGKSRP
jgi:hypothetical protein